MLSFAISFTAACTPIKLTPVTEPHSGQYNHGQIIWHDLLTDDVKTAKLFYAGLLGWHFKELDRYTLVFNGADPIGGMFELADDSKKRRSAGWITYFSVSGVDDTADWVESTGGKILKGPGEMINRGRYATVLDPLGAPLVLLYSEKGDPIRHEVRIGGWLWNELWSSDVERSLDFYQALGSYAAQKASPGEEQDYWLLLDRSDRLVGGITAIPFEDLASQWVPVVRVADTVEIAAKVVALGGNVIIAPDHPLSSGSVALIRDPTGGIFMVESWNPDNKTAGQQR